MGHVLVLVIHHWSLGTTSKMTSSFLEQKEPENDRSHSRILWNMNAFSLSVQFNSVTQSCPTLWPHESQHARPPYPSPTPGVRSNSCPPSQWCHPANSSSVIPFPSCPQSLPAPESFPMSQLFAWASQSTGVSALASFLPKNTQDWSPLEWTGWISLPLLRA